MDEERIRKLKLFEPYKGLFDRGKGWDKEWSKRDCWYVWVCTSNEKENPYRNYKEDIRLEQAFKDIYPSTWKRDEKFKVVLDAIQRVRDMNKTVEDRLLDGSIHAAEELATYFQSVSFSQTTKDGAFLYDPGAVLTQLKNVGGVIESLRKLREEQAKNEQTNRVLGGRKKGNYED